jgi:hypothetical protein
MAHQSLAIVSELLIDPAGAHINHLLGQTKVGQADMPIGVYEDVFRLEIAMDDAVAMEMLECQHHLGRVETCRILSEEIHRL